MRDLLFLFDIDGTIMDSTGTGKKAYLDAFEQTLDVKVDRSLSFKGGIDRKFFKVLYNRYLNNEHLNLKNENELWSKFKNNYLNTLREYSSAENAFKIFPNSHNTIKILHEKSNVALVTGNIYEGAMIKLAFFNLNVYFCSGGFGEQADERHELVVDAISSSELLLKKKFPPENIFLFGDTKNDIDSALHHSVTPILIDHTGESAEFAENWKTSYYGTFENIENLLKMINEGRHINCAKPIFY